MPSPVRRTYARRTPSRIRAVHYPRWTGLQDRAARAQRALGTLTAAPGVAAPSGLATGRIVNPRPLRKVGHPMYPHH